jgi:hypothetical protein
MGRFMKPARLTGAVFLLSVIRPVFSELRAPVPAEFRKAAVSDMRILDVNAVECYVQNNGKIAENPATGGNGFFFPKGQREKSMVFTGGLWVIGLAGDGVRSAAAYYATEFQPGRILDDGRPDDPLKPEYRIHQYRRAWGEAPDAEAVSQGCPPNVAGDQMAFYVANDFGDHASVWAGNPVGLEVRCTAWGFAEGEGLDHALFLRYRILHKGGEPVRKAYVAIFLDPDLGQANDDNVGCDSTLGLGYVCNRDGQDDVYGDRIPALGCLFLQGPAVDSPADTAYLPDGTSLPGRRLLGMTSFFAWVCAPREAGMSGPLLQTREGGVQAYHFAQGLKGDGEPWSDPTAGGASTRFPFAGDPVTGAGWLLRDVSDCGDVYMGIASGPFDLEPGGEQDVVVSLVAGLGSDHLNSVTVMKANAALVRRAYLVRDGGTGGPVPSGFGLGQNYPNPFNSWTAVPFSVPRTGRVTIRLFDLRGNERAVLADGPFAAGNSMVRFDAPGLATGVYLVRMESEGFRAVKKITLIK